MTNIHDERHFELTVNGERRQVVDVYPGESLLTVLRDRLGLTGAKGACEEGECGSCSVLLDGNLVCSCLVLAASATQSSVVTVEGLGGATDCLLYTSPSPRD